MILTEQKFSRSEQLVWDLGFTALVESLGYADALRFIGRAIPGQGDYVAWQDRIFGDASVDDIFDQAVTHWINQQSRVQKAE